MPDEQAIPQEKPSEEGPEGDGDPSGAGPLSQMNRPE
jgi:hypothetical protein